LRIVVEEEHEFGSRLPDALIHRAGKSRVAGVANEIESRDFLFKIFHRFIAAAVVDDDDLDGRNPFPQAGAHTVRKQGAAVVVDDDRREAAA
jgi:hypothetical protein